MKVPNPFEKPNNEIDNPDFFGTHTHSFTEWSSVIINCVDTSEQKAGEHRKCACGFTETRLKSV